VGPNAGLDALVNPPIIQPVAQRYTTELSGHFIYFRYTCGELEKYRSGIWNPSLNVPVYVLVGLPIVEVVNFTAYAQVRSIILEAHRLRVHSDIWIQRPV